MSSNKIHVLVESALMLALAMVLSYIKLFELPQGGSITLEMLPIVILALRRGTKTGCFAGFVFGILQMILGFQNVMYCQTILAMIGCIILDYTLAFTVLGLAPLFAKPFKNTAVGFAFGAFVAGLLRFVCSFLSGWLLWGSYAPEGMGAVTYSFVYNASYMIPNIIILVVVVIALVKTSPKLFKAK